LVGGRLDALLTFEPAYGGFNISVLPAFKPSVLTFLKAYGGVYAQVNIRGGGEFGELEFNFRRPTYLTTLVF
jgi:prolyl oligopeptidase PreP (S9A serine peptidase family)